VFHLANEAEGHRLLFSRIRALRSRQRTISAIAAHFSRVPGLAIENWRRAA